MNLKCYIIAGEASGDLHASNLMSAMQKQHAETEFRVWGGDLMQAAGGELVKHYRDLAFMGFLEVAKNIRTILNNLKFCKQDIFEYQPDVLILVDYPGFNLRIAEWAKQQSIRVFYYISPQIWAWKEGRVEKIRRDVERMFVILPFEKDFYKKHDVEVDFLGHPLLDVVGDTLSSDTSKVSDDLEGVSAETLEVSDDMQPRTHPRPLKGSPPTKQERTRAADSPLGGRGERVIALLPGSRQQEIKRMLSVMLEVVPQFEGYRFVIAGAPGVARDVYEPFLNDQVELLENQTYKLLKKASAALVTSGTATLETALFGVPQVVCYRGNALSYQIAKRLVKVDYISLVNLICEKEVVKELIQNDLTAENLARELSAILTEKKHSEIQADYDILREKLGGKGASERAAQLMLEILNE